jgi:hypothetical protein
MDLVNPQVRGLASARYGQSAIRSPRNRQIRRTATATIGYNQHVEPAGAAQAQDILGLCELCTGRSLILVRIRFGCQKCFHPVIVACCALSATMNTSKSTPHWPLKPKRVTPEGSANGASAGSFAGAEETDTSRQPAPVSTGPVAISVSEKAFGSLAPVPLNSWILSTGAAGSLR